MSGARCSSPAFAIGGISFDPATEMYDVPPFGWRCFHCNDHFKNPRDAQLHFGRDPGAQPACVIKGHFEHNLVKALRELEQESIETIAGLQAQLEEAEADYCRALNGTAGALMAAEQTGYDRGLADGRAEQRENRQ